jgi:PIN domain nuclease of toxin-antitoxin system
VSNRFLVTDTHPLLWYLGNEENRLPKRVLAAFKAAQEGANTHIWVPAATCWEISQLMRKTSRLRITVPFAELVTENFHFQNLTITELLPDDLILAHNLRFNNDPFDSLIVATAQRLDLALITADGEISDSKECAVFWK